MAALRQRMETLLKAQGDPRMEGRGEKVETGWVNPTDFEKQSIKP